MHIHPTPQRRCPAIPFLTAPEFTRAGLHRTSFHGWVCVRTHCRAQENSYSIRQRKPNNWRNNSESRQPFPQNLGQTQMKLLFPPAPEQGFFFKDGWSSRMGQTKASSMSLQRTPLAFPKIPASWSSLCLSWSPLCWLTDVSTTRMGFKEPSEEK